MSDSHAPAVLAQFDFSRPTVGLEVAVIIWWDPAAGRLLQQTARGCACCCDAVADSDPLDADPVTPDELAELLRQRDLSTADEEQPPQYRRERRHRARITVQAARELLAGASAPSSARTRALVRAAAQPGHVIHPLGVTEADVLILETLGLAAVLDGCGHAPGTPDPRLAHQGHLHVLRLTEAGLALATAAALR
ncbi:hypothetical protein [Streptacidiphilus sp. EB103A]|uniref:hypothetical protein n=1 Tax=Streptacidiphilus sp. EB103A TaxID=3156275 RepID=UPI0035166B37